MYTVRTHLNPNSMKVVQSVSHAKPALNMPEFTKIHVGSENYTKSFILL